MSRARTASESSLIPSRAPAPERAVRRPRLRWRWFRRLIIAGIWGTLAAAALLLWFARDLPRPESALDAVRRPSLTLADTSGRIFASYGDIVGETVHLSDLPAYVPEAAVAIEDHRFWSTPASIRSASAARSSPT